jgi:glycosyltransferase involved in cell wall biosynthesis
VEESQWDVNAKRGAFYQRRGFDYLCPRMVRVLHLSGAHPDFQTERGLAAIARASGSQFEIEQRTIGRGGDWRGSAFAWIALRGAVGKRADIVHAWDRTGLIAALAVPGKAIIYSPSSIPGRRALRMLRHIMQFRNVLLVCNSTMERDAAIAAGIDAARCQVIVPAANAPGALRALWNRPSPQPSPLGTGEREKIRAALGFGDDDFILLAPGESTRAAGHRQTLWAGSILHVLDQRYKVLIWGRGPMADACRRLAEKLNQPAVAVIAQEKLGRAVEYEELLAAADAVAFAPRGPTPLLPLMIATDAGLPVIATPSPWINPALTSAANWFRVARQSSRMLAQQVLKLRNENVGRIETSSNSGASEDFVEQYRRLYRS